MLDPRRVCRAWQKVDRQQVDRIHEEDPDENGDGKRCDELAVAMEGVAHLTVDATQNGLDDVLENPGHSAGRPTRQERHAAKGHDADQA